MKPLNKIIFIVLLFILSTTTVYGHRMLVEPIEDGVIKVGYDDGNFSEITVVTVFNKENEEIFSGALDSEGYFYYDTISDAARIVADDGMGHKVSWNVGDPISYSSGAYRWLKIIGVVLAFMVIAGIFYKRNKKPKLAT